TKFASGQFTPEPLDYRKPDVRGCRRPPMRQSDRAIDWTRDSTEVIARKIRAADSSPGVLDSLFGKPYYLYGAHEEDRLKGPPGEVLAQRHGAICRGTTDGAVWITHLKAKDHGPFAGLKLPAMQVLGKFFYTPTETLSIGAPLAYRTFREIRYVEKDQVGYLYFDFYNGAMSTEQCYRLRDAFLAARARPTKAIVLLGGHDFWSNGIHLNVIEAAANPAVESWRNINSIDDLIYEILTTMSHIVIAGLRGNAGAGGAMLALAADYVYARRGVVLNPHYKGMGGLYGSEYWTYTLPRRVGRKEAIELTEHCLPVGTQAAKAMGFLDDAWGENVDEFEQELRERARALASHPHMWRLLREKHEKRLAGECIQPLAAYRAEELKRMQVNFFGPEPAYHEARQRFVYKGAAVPRVEERMRRRA
ncbi:MAG TPA: enoyl-CoA hydratase-related protein, partial [Gammaproteobacteria bacterium]|nr:enoyl-CoA hydratase-related protein [Gammaproteobacteria bacterium]